MNKKFISAILAALLMVSTAAIAASAEEVTEEPAGAAVSVETSGETGKIRFDPGNWNSNKINFYIWDDTTGLKASKNGWVSDNTWGTKKAIGGTKLEDGTFESYEFDITPGNAVYVIFHDPDRGQTFDCVLTEAAFGDVAERTGEILENPVDSDQRAEAVRFKDSGLTSKLCITSTGKIQGETVPSSMDTAKEVATFIFKYQGTQDKNTKADVVTKEVLQEAFGRFNTSAEAVFDAYKALEGTEIATKDGGENGGYTAEKEKEAKKLLGLEEESNDTSSTASEGGDTSSSGDTSSTNSTATGGTTGGTTGAGNRTTTTTTTTTAGTTTTTDGTGASTETGDTTGTAAFAAIFLGAAAVMVATRKKFEE